MDGLDLEVVEGTLSICRLGAGEEVPAWGGEKGALRAVVRTREELSVVCGEGGDVPDGARTSGGWRAVRVAGTLELSLTGVLIALLEPLEEAGIPIFAISTFDTDYVLVPGDRLDAARNALTSAGHRFG